MLNPINEYVNPIYKTEYATPIKNVYVSAIKWNMLAKTEIYIHIKNSKSNLKMLQNYQERYFVDIIKQILTPANSGMNDVKKYILLVLVVVHVFLIIVISKAHHDLSSSINLEPLLFTIS